MKFNNISNIFYYGFFGLLLISLVIKGQKICSSQLNQLGRCLPITNCSMLANVQQDFQTPSKDDILRQSFCDSNDPTKVCCELLDIEQNDKCITPNNDHGVCVELSDCPTITNISNIDTLSKLSVKYLAMSECKGFGIFYVCCSGKDPDFSVVYEDAPDEYKDNNNVDALLPAAEQCAIEIEDESLITGINQYPWIGLIEFRSLNSTKMACSATLISKRYLLTSAHCVDDEAVVKIGEPINIHLGDPGDIHITIPIEEIIIHPRYFPTDPMDTTSIKKNDIALIRIKDASPFIDLIKPICILDKTAVQGSSYDKFNLKLAAREIEDTVNITRKILLHISFEDFSKCEHLLQKHEPDLKLWYKQLCTRSVGKTDSCRGDSGAPIFFERDSLLFLVGINNDIKINSCRNEQLPSVFTNVFLYTKWIHSNIKP